IAGLNKAIAQQIVEYRKEHGRFDNRQSLKNVPRLGERTFEQAKLQLTREPLPLCQLKLNPEITDLFDFKFEDIEIVDYQS
ncbi:thymidylate synthase, partial [Acinetobacter soli]|uniref:thymidylate synthase n=1 Tax=Acinetobacter soli TaxID=487316 RepID=UPI00209106EF